MIIFCFAVEKLNLNINTVRQGWATFFVSGPDEIFFMVTRASIDLFLNIELDCKSLSSNCTQGRVSLILIVN